MANYYKVPNEERFAHLPSDIRKMIEDFANLHHKNKEMSNTSFEIAKILRQRIPPGGDIRFAELWDTVYQILKANIGHNFEDFVLNYKIYYTKIHDPNMSFARPEDLQLYSIYTVEVYKQIQELVDMIADIYSICLNPSEYLNIQKFIWDYVNLLPSEALIRLENVEYKHPFQPRHIESYAKAWRLLNMENMERYRKQGIL